jgi:predicted acetyltransferase
VFVGFGSHANPEDERAVRDTADPDRAWAGFDDGAVVCTARDWDSELAVPGGGSLPAAALTAVMVLPTHRRRGLLRELMRRHLDGALERGQPLSVLIASEYPIYGRFGYGPATDWRSVELDTRGLELRGTEGSAGRFRLLDADAASRILPGIHEPARRRGSGDIRRTPQWWRWYMRDPSWIRGDAGVRFDVVYEEDGAGGRTPARGFATYRIREDWTGPTPAFDLRVEDLNGVDDGARAALWRYLAGVDLVATVQARVAPDEPLRWMAADPRRVRVTGWGDGIWVRLLDPAAALAGRRYAVPGRLALEVSDGFCPDAAGTWVLEGGPDGAACARGSGPADLALDAAELAAAYLGGTSVSLLAEAGRVRELAPGALARADAMLATAPLPFCPTRF